MLKIEVRLPNNEHERLNTVAKRKLLPLATWARLVLIEAADKALEVNGQAKSAKNEKPRIKKLDVSTARRVVAGTMHLWREFWDDCDAVQLGDKTYTIDEWPYRFGSSRSVQSPEPTALPAPSAPAAKIVQLPDCEPHELTPRRSWWKDGAIVEYRGWTFANPGEWPFGHDPEEWEK